MSFFSVLNKVRKKRPWVSGGGRYVYIYIYTHTHVIKDCFRLPIFLEIKMHSLLNMFWIFDWKAYLKKLGQPTCFDMVDPYYEVQQIHNSYYEIKCMKQVKGYWAATTHTHHCLNIFLDFYILAHFWYCVLFVHDCSSSNICSIHFVFHCVPTWLRMAHTGSHSRFMSSYLRVSKTVPVNQSLQKTHPTRPTLEASLNKEKETNQPSKQANKQQHGNNFNK